MRRWSSAELRKRGVELAAGPPLERVVALLKDRANTVPQLADEAMLFYTLRRQPAPADGSTDALKALRTLKARARHGVAGSAARSTTRSRTR